jgi:hypothetical protein
MLVYGSDKLACNKTVRIIFRGGMRCCKIGKSEAGWLSCKILLTQVTEQTIARKLRGMSCSRIRTVFWVKGVGCSLSE